MNVSTLSNAVTLQDLLLTCGRRRGWRTQRHIAVSCEIDETAYSRFVHGEQEIGATRTYALFRAVGVPAERIDLAYTLLEQAQRLARRPAGADAWGATLAATAA